MIYQLHPLSRFALMGGAYGNVPALKACLEDARNQHCEALAFLGDAIGYCGHSDEIVDLIRNSELDDQRLLHRLKRHQAVGFICTHSGLPWIRQLPNGRFAANCGVVGKPDHDADPAIHYAVVTIEKASIQNVTTQRVEYDYCNWADTLEREGIEPVFIEPLCTGIWTSGVTSLPTTERNRYLINSR